MVLSILALSFAFFFSFLLTCAFFCFFAASLRYWSLDVPVARSSHSRPTVSGAGICFVLVSALATAIALFVDSTSLFDSRYCQIVPLLSLPLALVGFLDDRSHIPPVFRLSAQFFTAFLLIIFSPLVDFSFDFLVFILLLLISVVAVINFTNFMDGLDGLVTGCMTVAIFALCLVINAPWSLWSLIGSLVGFLFWNWSPAKFFMGDVGSTFLGAVFAGLVLNAGSWSEAFACILVATPLLGDALICLIRRWFAGQSIFQAHRLHLFQRLHQVGWSHARVSLMYIMLTGFLALALISGGLPWVFALSLVVLLFGLWLDQCVAAPFVVVSKL